MYCIWVEIIRVHPCGRLIATELYTPLYIMACVRDFEDSRQPLPSRPCTHFVRMGQLYAALVGLAGLVGRRS